MPALTPNGVDSDVLQQVKGNIVILTMPVDRNQKSYQPAIRQPTRQPASQPFTSQPASQPARQPADLGHCVLYKGNQAFSSTPCRIRAGHLEIDRLEGHVLQQVKRNIAIFAVPALALGVFM